MTAVGEIELTELSWRETAIALSVGRRRTQQKGG